MGYQYGDLETFLLDNGERLFRFLVYKRLFTPYEQEHRFMDQSEYEETTYRYGFIRESVSLGNGDYLIGIQEVFDELPEADAARVEYFRLSELRLAYYPDDIKEFSDE